MGNIRAATSFENIWTSQQAEIERGLVKICPKNCWMVGTAAPVMKNLFHKVLPWVVANKIKNLCGMPISMCHRYFDVGQDPRQGDFRLYEKM